MSDVFLSYADEDLDRMRPLVDAVEKNGWSVFWDKTIPAGKTWRDVIGTGLAEARCVVVAWSEKSIGSSWVQEEADEGRERGILIPILIDPVKPPMGFRSVQAANLIDWNGEVISPAFQKLLADLTTMLRSPSSASNTHQSVAPLIEAQRGQGKPRQSRAPKPSVLGARGHAPAALRIPLLLTIIGWAIGGAMGLAVTFVLGEAPGWGFSGAIGWGVAGVIAGLATGQALRLVEPSIEFGQVGLIAMGWGVGGSIGGLVSWNFDTVLGSIVGGSIGGAIGGLITGHVLRLRNPAIQWTQVIMFSFGWAVGGGLGSGASFAFIGYHYSTIFYAAVGGIVGIVIGGVGGGLMLGGLASMKPRKKSQAL